MICDFVIINFERTVDFHIFIFLKDRCLFCGITFQNELDCVGLKIILSDLIVLNNYQIMKWKQIWTKQFLLPCTNLETTPIRFDNMCIHKKSHVWDENNEVINIISELRKKLYVWFFCLNLFWIWLKFFVYY